MSDISTASPGLLPVVWRPDGNVWIRFESGMVKLRKPKIKELRVLLAQLADIVDVNTDAVTHLRHQAVVWGKREEALAARIADTDTAPEDAEAAESELAELTGEVRKASRQITDGLLDGLLEWAAQAMRLLVIDGHIPEDTGDFDAFMGQYEFAVALKAHWETVPLRSGG